jgi:phosphoglycerate dehydrogenase-like enzyme
MKASITGPDEQSLRTEILMVQIADPSTGTSGPPGAKPVNMPVIAYRLEASHRERFATHWSRPRIIDMPNEIPAWQPTAEANVLLTFSSAWWKAPSEPPAGWPFNLRWLQLASAGADALPRWAYNGLTVTCSRGITARPIAEYVMNVLLDREKKLDTVRVHRRADALRLRDENLWRATSMASLSGQTLALVGLGAVGQQIARLANAFGMRVTATRRRDQPTALDFVELRHDVIALVRDADHLVVCAALTPETDGIVNAAVFEAAKPGLHVINIARGRLIDHTALLHALDQGRVGYATLDVTEPEPLPDGHPLYTHANARLTPHVAWFSADHHDRLTGKILDNLSHFARGEPLDDIVDPRYGY